MVLFLENNLIALKKIKSLNQQGFTLIEALVATLIVAVAFTGVSIILYKSTLNTATGNVMTIANLLAQEKMEEIKNMPDLSDITAMNGTSENNIQNIDSGTDGDASGIFTRQVSVSDGPNEYSKLVTVTVSWNRPYGRNGQQHPVVISSLTMGRGI